jgi:hypothetical protein
MVNRGVKILPQPARTTPPITPAPTFGALTAREGNARLAD